MSHTQKTHYQGMTVTLPDGARLTHKDGKHTISLARSLIHSTSICQMSLVFRAQKWMRRGLGLGHPPPWEGSCHHSVWGQDEKARAVHGLGISFHASCLFPARGFP